MMLLIRLGLVALALAVSAEVSSSAPEASGPMKESMETMKDASAVDREVARVQARLAETNDAAKKKAILAEEIAAAEAMLRAVEDALARTPGDADLKAAAANLRTYLGILRGM
jgi:hypothetical protein